ncbi:nuclear protein Sth1p/NPS1 [[Candida] railenensis]|uniref:Nuclear protein Sth1p/NPS1 n=1 Tax=[Candida] railenensis TaxID=45579 RepID=A0A9P0QPI3_9ASCO|nr:nuclear protein Sth1p/NPS1 [[Candida] railenensis]
MIKYPINSPNNANGGGPPHRNYEHHQPSQAEIYIESTPVYSLPQTRAQLDELIFRYQALLLEDKRKEEERLAEEAAAQAARERAAKEAEAESRTGSAESSKLLGDSTGNGNGNGAGAVPATYGGDVDVVVKQHVKDPELTAIEKVLAQVSEIQQKYLDEEMQLLEKLESGYSKTPVEVDYALLDKQIASLQLLSKDLDLPEAIQEDLSREGEESEERDEEEGEEEGDFDKSLAVDISTLDGSFSKKADILGIDHSYSKTKQESIYATLGNYYIEQSITQKIANRVSELENLPANLGSFQFGTSAKTSEFDDLKTRALIELKSLRVLAKQKQLRKNLIFGSAAKAHYDVDYLKNFSITLSAQRSMYVRPKIIQPDSHRLAAKLEERKELEAKRQEHELHVAKVQQILLSSEDIINKKFQRANKRATISRQINNFHTNTEKDEGKKLEKTAKQRLQALKANDEEAYMKLLDRTKDHRITHLLSQTNSFLDSLAQAVKVQQVEQGAEIPLEKKKTEEGAEGADVEEEVAEDTVDELREKIDYYQVAHRIQEEIKVQPSILVGGQLKEYQIKGLQWMVSLYNNKLNGILADEMGLGKTIQSISLVTYLIENKHESKFLVIVPLSTITNWTLEFEKWAPSVNVIVYKGSQQQRRSMQNDIRLGNFQVLLTTYEYIIRERPILAKFNYSHMIIDEGHRMKNASSKLSITLKQYYKTKNRLILTGTPLQNNLPELWALLNFVLPKVFNSVKSFDEWFNTPFANTGSQEKIELTEEESLLVIRRLHKVLRPFLLRRLKKDVEKDLPDKVEKVVKCKLSGLQYVLYQQMLKHNALFVGEGHSTGGGASKSGIKGLNNKIMQLRKICNHPFVFEEVETVLDSSRLTNDLIWRTSGKFELLDRVLPKFKVSGHRVLMFFQMTQVMDIMEDFLRWRDMKYLRLDGSTKADERQDMLKVFNAPNSDYFCFLLSTRAGGLGLNLQTADTVIIFDTDWNPHQDLQAQDRAHRIGQKNEVRILRLISNDSVEEVILERAHQKLDIDGKVIQAGKFDNKSTAEEQEQFLKKLLEADSTKDQSEENDSLDDDELNEILARSEDEKILFGEMDAERLAKEKVQGGWKNRLITKEELPPVFKEDISHHFHKEVKELAKMREKKKVKYDDGLTEEQWLMAMDDDEDTVEDAIKRKEARMAKRKRRAATPNTPSSEGDEDDVDDDEDDEEEEQHGRKRRSRTPKFSDVDDEFIERGNKLLDEICDLKGEDGHDVSEIFLDLPSRKVYPDYYQIIKKAVSINQLRKKLKQDKIESYEQLLDELKIMVANAKTYNESGSWVYNDAEIVENFLNDK